MFFPKLATFFLSFFFSLDSISNCFIKLLSSSSSEEISPLFISSWSLKYICVTVEIRTVKIVTIRSVPKISTKPGHILIS